MKRCFKCLCHKPLTAFYRHPAMADGHLNKCIECTKADVLAHRAKNIERIRRYDSERANKPHRVAMRSEYTRKYRGTNPDRARANYFVNREVRAGRLQRWPCEVCGAPKALAHHPHYGAPLLVTWLCQPHHKQAHALIKED